MHARNNNLPLSVLFSLVLLSASPCSAQDAGKGKDVYAARCAQCHGVNGTPFLPAEDSDGDEDEEEGGGAPALRPIDETAAPAAKFVFPRPRDFTKGLFKIRSTPVGEVPTDADLERVVSKGMPGTSMPAWDGQLSQAEIRDVVAYLKTFSDRFKDEKPSKSLDLSGAVSSSKDSIEQGSKLYLENGCNSCHGEQGRGDGPSAATLKDEWGNPIWPANFHKPWTFRGGPAREDIFRTFMTGLNGTPMPSYLDVFGDTPEGRAKGWHIANYLASLGQGRPNVSEVLRAAYRQVLPSTPGDPAWDERLPVDFLLVGQVVAEPRQFTPSIDRVALRAFYDDAELAVLLEWDDRVKDDGDAVALQVPRVFAPAPGESSVSEKPYFLRGDEKNAVELWRWTAKGDALAASEHRGAKAEPAVLPAEGLYNHSAEYKDGLWRLVIRRKLSAAKESGVSIASGQFVPLSVLAWDGRNGDEGMKSSIMTWNYLFLEPRVGRAAYAFPVLALLLAGGLEVLLMRRLGNTRGDGS